MGILRSIASGSNAAGTVGGHRLWDTIFVLSILESTLDVRSSYESISEVFISVFCFLFFWLCSVLPPQQMLNAQRLAIRIRRPNTKSRCGTAKSCIRRFMLRRTNQKSIHLSLNGLRTVASLTASKNSPLVLDLPA